MAHVEELRALLRLEGEAEDALLHALLAAAREQAERFCRREFIGSDDVPEAVRLAVLRLAAWHFAHRDGDAAAMPDGVAAMLRPWRRMALGGAA